MSRLGDMRVPVASRRRGNDIAIVTRGATFAPILVVAEGTTVTWSFADGSTSTSLTPTVNFGTAARRTQHLVVEPWTGLRRINMGFTAEDGGDLPKWAGLLALHEPQEVCEVRNLTLATELEVFACARCPLEYLDVHGMTKLYLIETFGTDLSVGGQGMAWVNIRGCSALQRACFESASLSIIDFTDCHALEDIRSALQRGPTGDHTLLRQIIFPDPRPALWHVCTDNNHMLGGSETGNYPPASTFPAIDQWWVWDCNQSGPLVFTPPQHPTSIQGGGNHYTSFDCHDVFTLSNPVTVGLGDNDLTTVNVAGCPGINRLYLQNNLLNTSAVDQVLADLVAGGRIGSSSWAELTVNLSGNAPPSAAGLANVTTLRARNWEVIHDFP